MWFFLVWVDRQDWLTDSCHNLWVKHSVLSTMILGFWPQNPQKAGRFVEMSESTLPSPWVRETCDAVRRRQRYCVLVLNHHLVCPILGNVVTLIFSVHSQSSTDIIFQKLPSFRLSKSIQKSYQALCREKSHQKVLGKLDKNLEMKGQYIVWAHFRHISYINPI